MDNKVYGVLYNSFVMESTYKTISLHKTKKGASKAMTKLKSKIFYKKDFDTDKFEEEWQKFGYKIYIIED